MAASKVIAGYVAALVIAGAQLHTAAQTITSEARLKAAYVSKFAQFVEWPDNAWTNRDTVDICVARPNPFGSELSALTAGEVLEGRVFVVRQVGVSDALNRCHVLYIHSRAADGRTLLEKVSSLPVLTVGDSPDFYERGVVTLRVVDGRIRFDVNVIAAERVGLRISSQLLRLALSVKGTG